ncbi:hypothetical protein F0562_009268 [Nyssa sinensis]|uniref:Uncharacterized protein n=1 Tax=Nyssa sinensis TaxID=561372 RepID=A0A5J4ZVQ8_9ASTE|nr:hypothetical protein F0562_009268 [Nyssa sinensis]
MLHLSKTQIEKLKNMANAGRAGEIQAYSRYEAITGHIWRCACKARENENEQLTKIRVAVNIRDRMKPPLPHGYFGNAMLITVATSRAGELMSWSLCYASSKLGEPKGFSMGTQILQSRAGLGFPSTVQILDGERKFTWAQGALGFDGKGFIIPGHDEDGSLVIPLSLQAAHMEAFEKFFYMDI